MTDRIAVLTVLFALACLPAAAQQDFSNVEVKIEPLSGGVYMLVGAGGNIGLSVGEDATFIVDDQFAPLTDRIAAAIGTVTDKPVTFVVNTHWHGDHTGGNENFGRAGAVIIAHDNVRRRMSTEQFNAIWKSTTPASPRAALPVVTFSESVTLHLNHDTVHVIHVPPAHTDGDSIVHFSGANVIHMGDLFVNGGYPFVDVSSGGHVDGIIGAADRGLALSNPRTKIIPGHGPLADPAALKAFRDVVATVRNRVAEAVKQGRSLEELQASQPTKEFDEKWGGGFMKGEQFVALAYRSLAPAKQ